MSDTMTVRIDSATGEVFTNEEYRVRRQEKEENEYKKDNITIGSRAYHVGSDMTMKGSEPTSVEIPDLKTKGRGILATAKTPFGIPTTQINDKTRVSVNGMEMEVQNAVHLGYLERTENGGFREVVNTTREVVNTTREVVNTARNENPKEEEEADVPLTYEGHSVLEAVTEYMGSDQAEGLANAFVSSIAGDDNAVERFAKQHGYSTEAVNKTIGMVYPHLEKQAIEYVSKKTGDNGREVLTWGMSEFNKESWAELLRVHWFSRSPKVYDAVIKEWKKHKNRK